MDKKIKNFRNGLLSLNTRRFGSVSEAIVRDFMQMKNSGNMKYNLYDPVEDCRVEVASSRAMKKNDMSALDSIISECFDSDIKKRMVKYNNRYEADYICCFQQLKRKEFDTLYYIVYFKDTAVLFKTTSNKIGKNIGFNDKQHRGAKGEGQFRISKDTIRKHENSNFVCTISYDHIYHILNKRQEE